MHSGILTTECALMPPSIRTVDSWSADRKPSSPRHTPKNSSVTSSQSRRYGNNPDDYQSRGVWGGRGPWTLGNTIDQSWGQPDSGTAHAQPFNWDFPDSYSSTLFDVDHSYYRPPAMYSGLPQEVYSAGGAGAYLPRNEPSLLDPTLDGYATDEAALSKPEVFSRLDQSPSNSISAYSRAYQNPQTRSSPRHGSKYGNAHPSVYQEHRGGLGSPNDVGNIASSGGHVDTSRIPQHSGQAHGSYSTLSTRLMLTQ